MSVLGSAGLTGCRFRCRLLVGFAERLPHCGGESEADLREETKERIRHGREEGEEGRKGGRRRLGMGARSH